MTDAQTPRGQQDGVFTLSRSYRWEVIQIVLNLAILGLLVVEFISHNAPVAEFVIFGLAFAFVIVLLASSIRRRERHSWVARIGPGGIDWPSGGHTYWSEVAEVRVRDPRTGRWFSRAVFPGLAGVFFVTHAQASFARTAATRPNGIGLLRRHTTARLGEIVAVIRRVSDVPIINE